MTQFRSRKHRSQAASGLLVAALFLGVGCQHARGGTQDDQRGSEPRAEASGALVVAWNDTAFEIAARLEGIKDPFPHLRTLTLMHLAMHDAVNAVRPKFGRFALADADADASPTVAAAAAAHGVLSSAYPTERALLDSKLDALAAAEPNGAEKQRGLALGKAAAQAILSSRARDGADDPGTYTPAHAPGRHRFVPPFELVYRPAWRSVVPFGLSAADQFRSAPHPVLDSAEYAANYEEVKRYGRASDSSRTPDQTFYADFWYELSEIGWNRIARVTWAQQEKQDLWFTARLFALLNAGLTDAYIAGWDSKLHYDFWRPYTAIRAGAEDGNASTAADEKWESYCVTPPVQDYPSTHSALGAAGAAILRATYGRDVPFTMESSSTKPAGQKRSLASFQQAAEENADSRVACGIHFRFATRAGLELGKRVGEHVLKSMLPSLSPSS